MTPPRPLLTGVIFGVLPRRLREPIAGNLEEEWRASSTNPMKVLRMEWHRGVDPNHANRKTAPPRGGGD